MEKEKITIETIHKLADLSQLQFTDKEKERLVCEVSGIIELLDQCGSLDVDDVVIASDYSMSDLREDEVVHGLSAEEAFANAPISKQDYLGVPKVV